MKGAFETVTCRSDGYRKTKLKMDFEVKFDDKIDKKRAQKKKMIQGKNPTIVKACVVGCEKYPFSITRKTNYGLVFCSYLSTLHVFTSPVLKI